MNPGRDVPTSLESLVQYRAAHACGPESQRVWFFHSHVYFDHAAPERVAQARAFMELIRETYAENSHVEVHSFLPMPAGPHPRGSFEVLFTRNAFAEFVIWLTFFRPQSLDILIHPLTRSQKLDHTQRSLWLGTRLDLGLPMLEEADASSLAEGRSEEAIVEGTKKHCSRLASVHALSNSRDSRPGSALRPRQATAAGTSPLSRHR